MDAVPIVACYVRQWPEDLGRPAVPLPAYGELGTTLRMGQEPHDVTSPELPTWCPRCGCDHGDTPRILPP